MSQDNGRVRRSLSRAAAALVFVPFWIFASALAPQHVHEGDADHHHGAVVHSHFEPHEIAQETTDPEIGADEQILWLQVSVVHSTSFQLDASRLIVIAETRPDAGYRSWSVSDFDAGAPAHGPPRSSASLRAPPAKPV